MPRAHTRTTFFAMTVFFAIAAGQAASADDGPPDEEESYSWGLGVGGMSKQAAYDGIDRENDVLPLIYFENRWVQFFGPRLDFKLPGFEWGADQELSFAVGIEYDGSGYKPGDAPILNGMKKREEGFLAGPSFKWSNPFVDVVGEWMFDASSTSDGQLVSLGLERSFQLGEHLMFTPSAAAVWWDDKYADYYFGVRSDEVRANRPAYTADNTFNAEFSLRTDYMFDERHTVTLSLDYTALGSEIKDSPLTGRSGESMILLGYLYSF